MIPKKIFTIVTVVLFVSCGLMFTPNSSVAASITLKVSHQFAAGDVRDLMAHAFGDMVTKKTNGEIKFRYYPAKSLFKPKEQWDAMRKGANVILIISYLSIS
jgi:TRAP-type C4-dicarboxylate transport system substrate-binding protein